MPQATYSVTIRRPVEEVFAFVADAENCPRWRPGVVDIKRISGDGQVGTRYAQGVKGPMNRRIEADFEITVFEPGKRIDFQTIAGPARPHGRYDFGAVAGGALVTFLLEAHLSGLSKLFMSGPVQTTMDAEVRNLDNLKRLMEA